MDGTSLEGVPLILYSRFTSRTVERGGSVRVLSRFVSDTVGSSAMVQRKMLDRVDSRIGKRHSDCYDKASNRIKTAYLPEWIALTWWGGLLHQRMQTKNSQNTPP
jgi:hypothetical protein